MRPPITFTYGHCVFARDLADPWAVFAIATRAYSGLPPSGKRELFLSLLGAIEALGADVQILRVSRAWAVDRYEREMTRELGGASTARG